MLQLDAPATAYEWAKVILPVLGLLFTAGWIGKLVEAARHRRHDMATASKELAHAEGASIENERQRLTSYLSTKDVMEKLTKSYEALSEHNNTLVNELRGARQDLNAARNDVEAKNAVIKYQQDENRFLIDREGKLFERIATIEADHKHCQESLRTQGQRLTELERLVEQKTEAGLRK